MRADRGVSAELRARRLVTALLAVLLVPSALVVGAAAYEPPARPPELGAVPHEPLIQTPTDVALAELERDSVSHRIARRLSTSAVVEAFRLDAPLEGPARPGELPTVVLGPRAQPYTLAELRDLHPEVMPTGPDGAVLLEAHVHVGRGASLVVDGATPVVRLTSSTREFATLISQGTLTVDGTPEQPVSITSWDEEAAAPDADTADGRSFVLQVAGRFDADHAVFDSLGFGTGTSSGVAWRGRSAEPESGRIREAVTGTVTASTFTRNRFGAYTHEAEAMDWTGNAFTDNDEYGFDPHDFSNNFLVVGNTASGNGRHGFIFSRGCDNNVMRGNTSFDNAGHGFMIDDGRSTTTVEGDARLSPSDGNLVIDNTAYGNEGSGVEIEGGERNLVAGNDLRDNYVGVRVKDRAEVTVVDNDITDSYRYAVDVLPTVREAEVDGNRITGAWAAVNVAEPGSAQLGENPTTRVSTDLVLAGQTQRDTTWLTSVQQLLRWNPLLVLWGLILGVPLLVALLRRPLLLGRRGGRRAAPRHP